MRNRVHLIVSGDVVGVGFRSWIQRIARDLRLVGWVKNRADRTVELVAEGDKVALEKLLVACRKGPDVAWVEGVRVEWEKSTGKSVDFEVLY